ncbi:MAG: transporter substrate-binding domain-containing protein [Desulfamplus sp.]|nr:transporter substrate-binding domain-containing protein [Desulfamplus sp.]
MNKFIKVINFLSQSIIAFLIIFVPIASNTEPFKDPLTLQEREWLRQHDNKIKIAVEINYAPFAFIDENGINKGLATEYIELIEKKLNFKFNSVKAKSLNEVLSKAQQKEIDVVNAVTETPNRSKYLLFTRPFIEIPNVIIVRKDQTSSLTINQMKEMTVSLVKDYAVTEYLTKNYNHLNVNLVSDDLTALLNVSFNRSDSAIIDLATASYYIETKGITNLRIAGDAGYNIKLAIASRLDWPIFNQILEKGLSTISDKERKTIKDKWISLGQKSLFESREFWLIIITIFSVILLIISAIVLWNRILKRQVEQRTTQLQTELRERKKAEEALINEKERLMVTLRSIGDGVITTDSQSRVTLINTVAEELTGWRQDEAEGRHIHDVFHIINEHTRQICENPIEAVIKSGIITAIANNTILVSRDGTEYVIADSGAPILDNDKNIIGVVLVFRDITQQLLMEAELQQTQKLESIGILAGGIAHDFNNMLGVISGNTSYALSIINHNEELFEILTDIQKGTIQAQKLTQQLLTFSKGGAPIKKDANLNELLKESVLFIVRGSNISCEFILSDDLFVVEIDNGQMNQAISNIIINAMQAMPEGGNIQIKTENANILPEESAVLNAGYYVKITIKDHGIGISENHISKIFDPYFTTKQKGSGLGLATTYSIIKRHNGSISVESKLGKGTTFHIYLPAKNIKPVTEQKKQQIGHEGKGKILLMDDQEMILNMSVRLFGSMGYETSLAKDGEQAIDIYKKALESGEPFDLVVLDLTVPGGMGGAETIVELLKIDSEVKAIVSSGYSNDPVMANYQDFGFYGVIAKPFTKAQIQELLSKVLRKKI